MTRHVQKVHTGFARLRRINPRLCLRVPAIVFLVSLWAAQLEAASQAAPDGIAEQLVQWTDSVYTGGRPTGEAAFKALAGAGIRTLVSVDGARPDIEAARAAGLTYYHVPIGYDGVEPEAVAALARIFREKDSAFFVHCHHGLHRAPAAVAATLKAAGLMSGDQALELMTKAGTSKNYTGLWSSVRECGPDTIAGVDPELRHVAPVAPLAEMMSQLDEHWDLLQACADAGWQTPATHPDAVPSHEALLVLEMLKRIRDELPAQDIAPFHDLLEESVAAAEQLHHALAGRNSELRQKYLAEVGKSCGACHQVHRD